MIFAIQKNDAFIPIWRSGLKDRVMEALCGTLDWTAVDVIRRGLGDEAEDNPITIFITMAVPEADAAWESLASSISTFCRQAGRADVAVHVEQGELSRLRATLRQGMLLETPYATRIPPGSSVGAPGGPSGTLGGYLEVNRPGEKTQVVGLTCHHVAVAAAMVQSPVSIMVSPADNDHKETLHNLEGIPPPSSTRPSELHNRQC
jgi:hypothetical protein